jgi:hypothetical protein
MSGNPDFVFTGDGSKTWRTNSVEPVGYGVSKGDYFYNTASNKPAYYSGTNWVYGN